MKQKIIIKIIISLFISPLFIHSQEIQEKGMRRDSTLSYRIKRAANNHSDFYGQYFNNILPEAPTAGELMRYTDLPVDWAHGIPSIEIPLYTIECGELSLPITLSYHAGGIKVDQVATWVGLGWSLNAGGAVTTYCIDDKYGNFESRCYDLMTVEQLKEYMKTTGFDNEIQCTQLEDMYSRQTIPDLGSYNFMGYSGRFFMYASKAYELYGNRQLTFTNFYPTVWHTFSAKDLKGRRYDFGYQSSTQSYSVPNSLQTIEKNCWKHMAGSGYDDCAKGSRSYWLTKVVGSTGKDSIQISYGTQLVSYKTMATGVQSRIKGSGPWTDFTLRRGTTSSSTFINETHSGDAYVTEIVASNGIRISFTLNEERNDLISRSIDPKPKALSEVNVYTPSGELFKRWVFEYGYFQSYLQHPKDPSSDLRLKLISVKEYGGASSDKPRVYSFSYYGEEPGEPQMPFRASFAGRDYFGYCNSIATQSQATSFWSSFPIINVGDIYVESSCSYWGGRDLSVNEKFNHAYSLKSIKYPTGGKRVFKYKANTVLNTGYAGICIHKIINYYSESDSTVQEFSFQGGYVTELPRFTRTRWRDEYANPLEADYAVYEYIEDISSTPFSNLASLTGNGITYISAKEKREDTTIEYIYKGDDMNPRYSGYRVLVQYDPLDAWEWDGYCVLREGEVNKGQPDFNYNYICPDYKHGYLQQKTIWSNNGYSLIDEIYEYEFEDRERVPIMQISFGEKEWSGKYFYYDLLCADYITGKTFLKNKTTYYYQHEDADPYEVQKQLVETYAYNGYDLLNNVTTLNSNNQKLSVETRYVSDVSASPYIDMVTKGMIDYPVEVIRKVDGKVTGGTLMTYVNENNLFLKDKIYELKPSSTSSNDFIPFNGTPSSLYGEPTGVVNKFTSYGKIAAMRGKDQVNVVYLWGYNNMYPIAEIKNVTYEEVSARISEFDIESIAARLEPALDDWNRINQLRVSLPHAHISVLTYKPLVGVTSICGPDERTLYYDYDSFGQLKEIYRLEDGVKRTIENYDYHYSGK